MTAEFLQKVEQTTPIYSDHLKQMATMKIDVCSSISNLISLNDHNMMLKGPVTHTLE